MQERVGHLSHVSKRGARLMQLNAESLYRAGQHSVQILVEKVSGAVDVINICLYDASSCILTLK